MIMRVACAITFFLLLLMTPNLGYGRFMGDDISLVSDAFSIGQNIQQSHNLSVLSTVTCEPTYGFLPCTTAVWGQLFLIVVYEYLLSIGEKYVSDGSELFFQMIGPNVFGGSLFHLLGTIPEVALVLVSGLSATTTTAEEQAVSGMSLLAGSTVMLLTIIWGSCIAFGSKDLSENSNSSVVQHLTPKCLKSFGATVDVQTSYTGRIMILSIVPFIILQIPKIIDSISGTRVTVLLSLLVTLAFLFAYMFYQAFQPWIGERKFGYMMQKFEKDKLQKVLVSNGTPDVPLMKEIFHEIDTNNDGFISKAELSVFLLGIHLQQEALTRDENIANVMEAFDASGDHIDEGEFVRVLTKWLTEGKKSVTKSDHSPKFFLGGSSKRGNETIHKNCLFHRGSDHIYLQDTPEEQQSLLVQNKKTRTTAIKSWWNCFKATFLVTLGTTMLLLLGSPLITSVTAVAKATTLPSFFIPYVVIPLALNCREAIAAITSARKKTEQSISLTLSEIYGGVFMNSMVGLTTFLAIVYIRDLSWDVSAEVLVVLIVCTVIGLFASLRTKFPLWTSFIAYLLYPISLLLLYVLTTVLGWS
ncbi:hypothetical protein RJ640_029987 [Escallonia rubra]|uniref:EF-hand domain-containing protein n=1 Tax=Escallonia rubra TaxID=112253 RepID=A0AA88QU52_9ASTE|nr:hypothetical protein RJ640_029987 [Escallonia rubra]